jgi:hypothetical protein
MVKLILIHRLSIVNLKGDFIIQDSGTFEGSSNVASAVNIEGNFSNSGVFNPEKTKFVLNRSSTVQTISGDLDSSNAFTRLEIDNPDGVVNNANDTLIISDTLYLTNGILQNDSFVLIRNNGVIVPDTGKPSSYVEGKLLREIFDTDEKAFPVGTIDEYAPFTVDPDISHNGRIYQVHYVDSMHPDALVILPVDSLDRVSFVEYWQLDELSNANASQRACQVGMYWRTFSEVSSNSSDWDSLRACFFNASSQWDTIDNSPIITGYSQNWGKIKSSGLTSTFTPITIGSKISNNPLPVNLTFFRAEKLSDDQNLIAWQTAAEWNCKSFEVFHELNGEKSFLHQLKCSENSTSIRDYSFVHPQPQSQEIYWLKQIDYDGKVAWYGPRIVSGKQNLTLYPNPAQNHLHILTKDDIARVDLIDALGKTTSFESESLNSLNISGLRSGLYQVVISFKSQKPVCQTLLIAR